MVEAMYVAVGLQLHTHNDLLDMLGVGGVFGIVALGILIGGLMVQIRTVPIAAPEAALAVALLLVLWCQGFFTGQIFMPDIMTFYLLGISCAVADARKETAFLPPIGHNALSEPQHTRNLRRSLAAFPRT
jgi:O-antigen ligase